MRVRVRMGVRCCAVLRCAALGGGAQPPPCTQSSLSVCILPLTNSCLRVDGSGECGCGCECQCNVTRGSAVDAPSGRLWQLLTRIGSDRIDSLRLDSKQSVTNGNCLSGLVGCLSCAMSTTEQQRHEEHAHQTVREK